MKLLSLVGFVFSLIFLISAARVYAGGCCYTHFGASEGIAGVKEVEISTGFVDPALIYIDSEKTKLKPLANQKIEAHVLNAKSGQACKTETEVTDESGYISAKCTSTVAGSLLVYFTAPELSIQANEMIKSVPKQVNFAADSQSLVAPTASPQAQDLNMQSETEELQKRVDSLELQVKEQEVKVNKLQEIVNSLRDFFKNLFK